MRILLQYKKKLFSLFFSRCFRAQCFWVFNYNKKKCIYLCVFMYPVRYNFVVILFEENRFGFNFEQMELFCNPHIKGQKNDVCYCFIIFLLWPFSTPLWPPRRRRYERNDVHFTIPSVQNHMTLPPGRWIIFSFSGTMCED